MLNPRFGSIIRSILLGVVLFNTAQLSAQEAGSIQGRAVDPAGATVPGAKVAQRVRMREAVGGPGMAFRRESPDRR